MTIDLKPETEQLVLETLQTGHFQSIDDLIQQSVSEWRATHGVAKNGQSDRAEAVDRLRRFVDENRTALSGISIKDLIHEGHRV